jgi:hypothetical protein
MSIRKIVGGLAALAIGVGVVAAASDPSSSSAKPDAKPAAVQVASHPAKAQAAAVPRMTAGQRNALASARDYLNTAAFSKSGLIQQLRYEHFSSSDARWAVAHVKVSWMAQAVKSARAYLDTQSFSRSGLREQLEYEGFTPAQAAHGVSVAYR